MDRRSRGITSARARQHERGGLSIDRRSLHGTWITLELHAALEHSEEEVVGVACTRRRVAHNAAWYNTEWRNT